MGYDHAGGLWCGRGCIGFGGPVAECSRIIGHAGLLIGAVVGVILSIQGMLGNAAQTALPVNLPQLFPFVDLALVLDGLSAFFFAGRFDRRDRGGDIRSGIS